MPTDSETTYILTSHQTPTDDKHELTDSKERDAEKDGGGEGAGQGLFGIPSTCFNFINAIVGSGIISMPYVFKQAGCGLGLLILGFIAIISDYSVMLLVEGGRLANADTYQDVVLKAFGSPGFHVLTVLQFLYPFISMVSYNVTIGDTITKIILWMNDDRSIFVTTLLGNRYFVIFLMTILMTLPLSLYRNIGKLGKWAFLSIVMIVFIVVSIIIRLVTFAKHIPVTEDAWNFAGIGVIPAIGIVSFSYMCQHNTLMVHRSLERPTAKRWGQVVHISVFVATVMNILVGLVGYISFTGFTEGDLLESYCRDDVLMNCARLAFAFTIMLTYPVDCFVTREVVENALPFTPSTDGRPPLWRHIVVTVIIAFLAAVVSMATDCLGIVLALNGVLMASPLAFIFPPCSVISLKRPQTALLSASNLGPALLAVFGLLVTVVGTVLTVVDTVNGLNTCTHGAEPAYCHVGGAYVDGGAFLTSNGSQLVGGGFFHGGRADGML